MRVPFIYSTLQQKKLRQALRQTFWSFLRNYKIHYEDIFVNITESDSARGRRRLLLPLYLWIEIRIYSIEEQNLSNLRFDIYSLVNPKDKRPIAYPGFVAKLRSEITIIDSKLDIKSPPTLEQEPQVGYSTPYDDQELREYAHQFPSIRYGMENKINTCGVDVSPSYGEVETYLSIIPWVKQLIPKVHLLFIYRRPIDRIFSTFRSNIITDKTIGVKQASMLFGSSNISGSSEVLKSVVKGENSNLVRASILFDIWINSYLFGGRTNWNLNPKILKILMCKDTKKAVREINAIIGVKRKTKKMLESIFKHRHNQFAKIIAVTCYFHRLQYWLREFPREQLLIINHKKLLDPQRRRSQMETVFNFLGVGSEYITLNVSQKQKLLNIYGKQYRDGGTFADSNAKQSDPKEFYISLSTRKKLRTFFNSCDQKLDSLLEDPVDFWNNRKCD